MKALKLSALALLLAGSSAAWADPINFTGTVSTVTCNASVGQNGATLSSPTVSLGTVAPSATGSAVNFAIMPDASQAGCQSLTTTNTATTTWSGNFGATGLTTAGSAADDAMIEIKTVNAKTTAVSAVTSSSLAKDFDGAVFKADGAKYTATLKGGTKTGAVSAAATYTMSYQ
ncbi:hypothetical protein NLN92_24565 [Citrobacter portucalensis]|uniref:hypothetical protein n=1 Tax=Citrobacter portucalensis TaxID=1639133 RepID=UPI00226B263B|nr:hypothetical protein [Citrobacter portucalensis]MCX8981150.1 hypothetical protein [Citrobacter portucalensis]